MHERVMIVDDEFFIRLAVRELFESEGIEVTTASGADECLSKLEKGFRGVILMDVMMPGKDGWDTIREIVSRQLFEGNAIVMLTARDRPDEKMDGLQLYVIDYISKPFEPDRLVATVREYFAFTGRGE